MEHYGVYIEGDLCPRCRYELRAKYGGKVSDMPVTRVTFSEYEAVGIGYYLATNPNPSDASLLVGSVDSSRLDGDRLEVAGKAFRLDGELNVANRGIMELVEIFKADAHLLTTLLSLAQEQLIKMERFGSVYADEVIVGHSNEGDFDQFKADERSEALKDRIIEIQIPYNLTVGDEVKIYDKMVRDTELENVHMAPLTLPAMSIFAVLSRLDPPDRQGMSLLDKLRLYDGIKVPRYSLDDVPAMRRHSQDEGMSGISPRYVMNRLSAVASMPDIHCITPLNALNSLWEGLRENISLDGVDLVKYIELLRDAVEEYGNRAVEDVQRAFKEGFDESATDLLSEYLSQLGRYVDGGDASEREMREMEKQVGVVERGREEFRRQVHGFFSNLKARGIEYDHKTEPRLKAAIEARLFPTRRTVERTLTRPRFARQRVEWRRERTAIFSRLAESYGYCSTCAEDVIEFALHVLKSRAVVKSLKNEGITWEWELRPSEPGDEDHSDQ
jgi:serine protein kinase